MVFMNPWFVRSQDYMSRILEKMWCTLVMATLVANAHRSDPEQLRCDVLIAGGSTAALSAAITAAVVAQNTTSGGGPSQTHRAPLSVCLTEPTDWLGGQLAYNPAIDYGTMPKVPGKEFRSLIASLSAGASPCWVSKSCYPPPTLEDWVVQRLKSLPNLHVLLRTVVRAAVRDATTGQVTGLVLVTRTPKQPTQEEWKPRLSEVWEDWCVHLKCRIHGNHHHRHLRHS
jgi:hypothetical protein